MTLRLSIENLDRLSDGGPLRVQVQGRGLDIGRDQHLDWTLPDPSRHVSSKHCEIRFSDGGYWLHDVSTNGTFVNGAQFRPSGPHLLRSGDRLTIGPYIIVAEIEGQAGGASSVPQGDFGQASALADSWGAGDGAAEPDDRRAYMPQPARPTGPDFLDFASGIPSAPLSEAYDGAASAPSIPPEDDWLHAKPAPPTAPPAAPPMPTPRSASRPKPAADFTPPIADDAPVAQQAATPPEASPRENDLLLRIAHAAGIAERAFESRDPAAVADDIGAVLRLMAYSLSQMLSSRSETKGVMRSSSRTMIRAFENNPLKFTASPEEALSIMFGPPTRNYLNAQTAVERSFADLKAHQIQTFGAMQAALEALFDDLAPEKIDKSIDADRGLGGLVGSRKARLWDTYVERWRAKAKRSDGRLTDAFMMLFAESYDRLQKKEP